MGSLCARFSRGSTQGEYPVESDRPDILDLDSTKIQELSDSDRANKNLRSHLLSSPQGHEIIDTQAKEAIQGFYGKMRKQNSIDPDSEYSRLVNVVWPEQIAPHLSRFLDSEKRSKLLCGFVLITFDIAKGRFIETLSKVANVIQQPLKEHYQAPADLQRTIALGKHQDRPDEFVCLSRDMQTHVMAHFRKEAEKVNLGEMANVQAVLQVLYEQMYINHREKSQLAAVDLLDPLFQRPLARVMWMMANSQPDTYRLERPRLMRTWSAHLLALVDVTDDSETQTEDVCIKYYCKPVLYLENKVIDKGLVKIGSW